MTTSDPIHGRGASWNPPNRFERLEYVADEELPPDERPAPQTLFLRDPVRTIIARNDSPDVGFAASINPYRGCEHGCIYCFARPFHEYLGFSAGLDFETKIVVKEEAPQLLRAELTSPKWEPQVIVMSGVTDCYQPIEKTLKLTRGCLEVLAEFRNPVGIITKNQLVARDADILGEMARSGIASVAFSVTSLDENLARILEPRTSAPRLRLEAIRKLADAGVPVTVLVAPVIPAINDHEIPAILRACAAAGAVSAGYVMLRLPHAVAPLFEQWLEQHFPDRKEKVLGRVREMRGGKMYDPRWRLRQRGEGVYAEQIRSLFGAAVRRAGLDHEPADLRTDLFRRPATAQRSLFE